MRVYMSDRHSAGDLWLRGVGSIPQWDLAAQSEREARRILADTETNESDEYGRATYHVSLHNALPGAYNSQYAAHDTAWGEMLAESLAAFVSLDIE